MPDPYKARRWRQAGSEGDYVDPEPIEEPEALTGVWRNPEPTIHLAPPEAFPLGRDATIPDTLVWVGDDRDRARAALAYEESKRDPRRTLLVFLARKLEDGG